MNLTATILITTKNRIDDLRIALKSCLIQEGQPEILVISDGSTDGTQLMVQTEFPTVTLVHHEQSTGYVLRRNEGTEMASGDIVFSIDDDAEFSSPYVIAQTVKDFVDSRIGAIAIPFINVNESQEIHQVSPEKSQDYISHYYRGTAYAIRKTLSIHLGGYRPFFIHQGEEMDLCMRILNAGFYVKLGSSDVIYHYESPKRNFFRMDYFGRRNDVLTAYLNAPLIYLFPQLVGTTINGILFGFKIGRPLNMIRGLIAGYFALLQNVNKRAPIKQSTYKTYRHLKKNGPQKLSQIQDLV